MNANGVVTVRATGQSLLLRAGCNLDQASTWLGIYTGLGCISCELNWLSNLDAQVNFDTSVMSFRTGGVNYECR